MVTCPLCEHTQASTEECESCGKRLVPATAAPVATQAMVELERTAVANPRLQISAEPMAELELTKLKAGPDLPAAAFPEMERTLAAPAAVQAVPMVADLESGRIADDGVRTAVATDGPVTCRYCKNVQATGSICDKCGMRLPRVATVAANPTIAVGEEIWVRCKCGSKAKVLHHCGNCGDMVAAPAE